MEHGWHLTRRYRLEQATDAGADRLSEACSGADGPGGTRRSQPAGRCRCPFLITSRSSPRLLPHLTTPPLFLNPSPLPPPSLPPHSFVHSTPTGAGGYEEAGVHPSCPEHSSHAHSHNTIYGRRASKRNTSSRTTRPSRGRRCGSWPRKTFRFSPRCASRPRHTLRHCAPSSPPLTDQHSRNTFPACHSPHGASLSTRRSRNRTARWRRLWATCSRKSRGPPPRRMRRRVSRGTIEARGGSPEARGDNGTGEG